MSLAHSAQKRRFATAVRRSAVLPAAAHIAPTHAERIVYPDAGITKGQVFEYYHSVAQRMLPELSRRPLSLLRSPGGIQAKGFFQKHHTDALGEHVHPIELRQKSGIKHYLWIDSVEGLLELVQMNAVEFHPWGSRVDDVEGPDRIVFDLDPAADVAFPTVRAAAQQIREHLERLQLRSFVRTTGGKGLHVLLPFDRGPTWAEVEHFSEAFAQVLVQQEPQRYVATMSKALRKGHIFIDWFRNNRGSTSAASWSLRARPGAPVAMPLLWEELDSITSADAFRLENSFERALTADDPWADLATLTQQLPKFGE